MTPDERMATALERIAVALEAASTERVQQVVRYLDPSGISAMVQRVEGELVTDTVPAADRVRAALEVIRTGTPPTVRP